MKKAVKGISYISHPLRLRILEYLDVNGQSSVSAITKALGAEQAIVSQSLKKCARTAWLKRQDAAYLFITTFVKNIRQAFCLPAQIICIYDGLFLFLQDGVKAVLPADYTMMTANRMKLFAHYDKMRIWNG